MLVDSIEQMCQRLRQGLEKDKLEIIDFAEKIKSGNLECSAEKESITGNIELLEISLASFKKRAKALKLIHNIYVDFENGKKYTPNQDLIELALPEFGHITVGDEIISTYGEDEILDVRFTVVGFQTTKRWLSMTKSKPIYHLILRFDSGDKKGKVLVTDPNDRDTILERAKIIRK